MSDYIFITGIMAFLSINITVFFKYLKLNLKWHKRLGITTYTLVLIHGSLALYRTIRLYLLYS